MSWARLDDHLHDDPRTDAAKLEAMGLFAVALSWMAEKRTATISRERLFKLAGRKGHWLAEKLVSAGWWERLPDRSYRLLNPGGFLLGFKAEPPDQPPPVKSGVQFEPPPVQSPSEAEPPDQPPSKPGGVPAPPFPSPPLDPRAHDPDPDPDQRSRSGSLRRSGSLGRLKEEIRDLDLPLFGIAKASEPSPLKLTKDPPPTDVERRVFDGFLRGRSWRGVKGSPPVLDVKRLKLIRDRMREGHRAATLTAAAFGIWVDGWHFEKGHARFDLALRDAEHIEKFARLHDEREQDRARFRDRKSVAEPEEPPLDPQDLPPPGYVEPTREELANTLERFGLHSGAKTLRERAKVAANG